MTTARDIIKRALRQIGELASGEDPPAEDAADALTALNGMLAAWEIDGIRIGLPALAINDTVTLPASQIDGITYNLATALAPEYNVQISPALATLADRGKAQLQRAYLFNPVVQTPRELSGTYRIWTR